MDCALWLNKHKIYSADEIPEYPDIAALRGYYLGGSLEKWLREHNGAEYADRLAQLDCGGEALNAALAEIFGGKPEALKEMRGELSGIDLPRKFPFSGSYRYRGSYLGSYRLNSYRLGSFREWERRFGSYRLGSYRSGSFHEWEWEWCLGRGSGSYRSGSFRLGSFSQWEWEWYFGHGFGSYRLGSFGFGSFSQLGRYFGGSGGYRFGSYRSGSFRLWEWEWEMLRGSFGSYRLGSFRFASFSSYKGFPLDGIQYPLDGLPEGMDEYDRIMFLNLVNCPLNRYGYGIHNI